MSERKLDDNPIGIGFHAKVYSFKFNKSQTKKELKKLVYKKEKEGWCPYLLELYDFKPKYYNQYFMEIGKYENKSKQRTLINILYKLKKKLKILLNSIYYIVLQIFPLKKEMQW